MKKKLIPIIFAATISLSMLFGCGSSKDDTKKTTVSTEDKSTTENTTNNETSNDLKKDFNIAMLKGPTAIGFIKAWEDSDNNIASHNYNVTAYGTADEITAGIVKGTIDAAAVPCNLASVLYNKTEGKIKVAGVNTLGVLYMVSTSDQINSLEDLKGKTIYSTGQGTTPEYTLNYILEKNGLTPGTDVTIEYKSEAAEIASILSTSEDAIALLPQPYVTTVLMNNDKAKIIFNMTKEWEKVSDNSSLVTGVIIVRNEFLSENEAAFKDFLNDYENSTKYVNASIDEAAALIEKHDIFKAAVAKKAIPYCNITFIQGNDMKSNISSYLNVLFNANPKSVGGKLPDDNFYYIQ